MFLQCREETSSGVRQCELMTISDALPVQFWLSECETYNEHEAGGVHHECWCVPWECDDPITIQFKDTPAQSRSLLVKNPHEAYLYDELFTEVQSGVYQLSLIPDDHNICDERIQLLIADATSAIRMPAPSAWTSPPPAAFDVRDGTHFIETLTSADFSTVANVNMVIPSGKVVGISYTVEVTGTWVCLADFPILVTFAFEDGGGNFVSTNDLTLEERIIRANGTYQVNEILTTTDVTAKLRVTVISQISSGSALFVITVNTGQIVYISASSISAKSDCLDIATTQDETIFIEYSNHRNFAGLVYEDASPDLTFGIRVPCRFVHEIEPEEDEAMELTSSIVTTSAQLKTQRLLEVKHAPYYFHKKLRRVLKHQTLTTFDKSWKKEEAYEVVEGNKRWPLKAATCYLTEGNSVVRNVL